MKGYIKPLVTFMMLLIFSADGLAEYRSLNNQDNMPDQASARIKLRVVIPEVLLFRNGDTTSSLDTLTFPTSVTTSTGNESLVLHGNSGPASIVNDNGTAAGTTYTATSL
jgi:hypothetical protein